MLISLLYRRTSLKLLCIIDLESALRQRERFQNERLSMVQIEVLLSGFDNIKQCTCPQFCEIVKSTLVGQCRNTTILLARIRITSYSSLQTRSVISSQQISTENYVEGMGQNIN
jgi:hypothetical protein